MFYERRERRALLWLAAGVLLLVIAAWPSRGAAGLEADARPAMSHRDPTATPRAPVATPRAAGASAGFVQRLPLVQLDPRPTPTPTPRVDPTRAFGYGASLADLGGNGGRLREMGFGYVKSYLPWSTSEPVRGRYQWVSAPTANDANNIARDAERHGLRLVMRVDTPPAWAAPGSGNRPPTNPDDFGAFMEALATYLRGRVVAYEIWNEPNLSYEWGNRPPSPEEYTRLLRAAYPRIKAADPNAIVIAAGLASTGGDGGATAMNDLEFIRRMYAAGARGSFDVLGSHPYGFASAPDQRNANGVTDFQRAADQYAVMVENGDGGRAIWATEMGWLLDPGAFGQAGLADDPLWAGRQWQRVSPETQAQYLVQAYSYARERWPWMGVMLLFNLDFSTVPWYPAAEPMRWYSILNPDRSTRPAFEALRGMPKPLR